MYERNCDPITEPHQTHQDESAVGVPINMTILL